MGNIYERSRANGELESAKKIGKKRVVPIKSFAEKVLASDSVGGVIAGILEHSMGTVWAQYGHSSGTVWEQYKYSMSTVRLL